MLTAMDAFDSMLEKIQQFPLDANTFERHLKRLNKTNSKYMVVHERLVSRLTSPQSKRYSRVAAKIKRCLHRKLKIIRRFESHVSRLLSSLKDLARQSGVDLHMEPLQGSSPAVVRLEEVPCGTRKYCSCNGRASGTMICCDNPKCEVKWFHSKCMGLGQVPKGGWLCPKCTP